MILQIEIQNGFLNKEKAVNLPIIQIVAVICNFRDLYRFDKTESIFA